MLNKLMEIYLVLMINLFLI